MKQKLQLLITIYLLLEVVVLWFFNVENLLAETPMQIQWRPNSPSPKYGLAYIIFKSRFHHCQINIFSLKYLPIIHSALTAIILRSKLLRARLVHVFKNWKLLFKNFYGNMCGWKSVWKYVKYCLKIENCCLKTLTKHPLIFYCVGSSCH